MKYNRNNMYLYFGLIVIIMICVLFASTNMGWKEMFTIKIPDNFNLEHLIESVGTETLYKKTSKHQQIKVIRVNPNEYGYNTCLILNNEIQFCNNDEKLYHEFIAHFPVAYLKNVEHVLIVGGGDLMTLREIMKYKTIQRVDVLELDKKVIDVSLKYFTENNISKFENDERVHIHIGDATQTIQKLPSDVHYDLVILDVTEDSENNSPVEKRPFFQACKQKMKKNSVLVKNGFVVNTMPKKIKERKMNIYNDLKELFAHIGVYEVDMATYEDSNTYKFILASDTVQIGNSPQNETTSSLKLDEYEYEKHSSYISKK